MSDFRKNIDLNIVPKLTQKLQVSVIPSRKNDDARVEYQNIWENGARAHRKNSSGKAGPGEATDAAGKAGDSEFQRLGMR